MQGCDVWILGWRKLIAGSETVGSWLSVVGVPVLCIYWQFSLGQWMLENTAREVRAGEWALLYDSTSQCPGSCESLAGEWNRGQKLISCFAIFFFVKRSFFISPPVHLSCTTGTKGRASKITGLFPTCCSGTGCYLCSLPALLRLCTKLGKFWVAWAAPTFVISDADVWHLSHLEQVRVLCHPPFVNAWHFLSFGQELERKLVYLEKEVFLFTSVYSYSW